MKRFIGTLTILAAVAAACALVARNLDRLFEFVYNAQEAAGIRRQERKDEE